MDPQDPHWGFLGALCNSARRQPGLRLFPLLPRCCQMQVPCIFLSCVFYVCAISQSPRAKGISEGSSYNAASL